MVWEDDRALSTRATDIFAQRITGTGKIAPGWPAEGFPVCIAVGNQQEPRLASDGAGGAFIAWYDYRNDPRDTSATLQTDIYALRVTSDGQIAPGWQVDGNPICTVPEAQLEPTVVADGEGGAVICWTDARNMQSTGWDIYAQRVTGDGAIAPGWVADGVGVCTAPANQVRQESVSDGQGGAIVVWGDGRTDPDGDVFGKRILSDGTPAPGWPVDGVALCRAHDSQQALVADVDGLGGAVVAWEDYRANDAGNGSDIYVQRVTGEGVVPDGWPADGVAACTAPNFQVLPTVVSDGAGGAYVAWPDPRAVGSATDIYAQHVLASGAIAPGVDPDGLGICTAVNGQLEPVLTTDGSGGAILAWEDARHGGSNLDIFAHKLGIDGPVPALLSLAGVEATAERVVLTWYGKDAASLGAEVQRRTASTEWGRLGTPTAEGPDRLRFEDRAVEPGERYTYRLRYTSEGAEQFTDEVWVDVPTLALALVGLRPNPARGQAVVSFTLPSAEPARLEVIDLRGRRVWSREVGSLGPGSHAIEIGAPLRPGVYWLRLRQGQRSLTARGVVLP